LHSEELGESGVPRQDDFIIQEALVKVLFLSKIQKHVLANLGHMAQFYIEAPSCLK